MSKRSTRPGGRRGTVVRYSRHARRTRQWHLGDPPGRAGRRERRRRNWKGLIGLLAAVCVLAPPILLRAGDAINGFVKSSDGCRVVQVIDGDTVRMLCPGSGLTRGRLLGFDTPEYAARCLREFVDAQKAANRLRWILWSGREVRTRAGGLDRYGRVLTVLRVDGTDVAGRMIESGLARRYDGGRRGGWCGDGIGGFDV